MELDLPNATADELWAHCLREYESRSPIVRLLLNRFFAAIESLIRDLSTDATILEVGCGAGESSRRIMRMLRGQHFEASELDRRYVEKLREGNLDCPVRQESVYELDRPDRSFDCVILLEVLEHLEEPERALRELFRVSRKHVIVSVPDEPLWRILNFCRGAYVRDLGNTPGHINHWSRRSLARLVSRHGRVTRTMTPAPWLVLHAEVAPPTD